MPLDQATRATRTALLRALPQAESAPFAAWLGAFYAYQLRWLLDGERFALLLKARQIGASHTYAAAATLWGAAFGETTTIVSVGEREALEVLDKAERHATVLAALGSKWAKPRKSGGALHFDATGGRVIALPATSGGRSFSGNVILDEFAYHERPERVWDGAAAVVLHAGRLRVMSTPNGVGNLFHALWTNERAHAGYALHSVTIDEARADGLAVDDAECWKMARGDARVYDQLFRCAFLDNDAQYIPSEAVNACSTDDLYTFDGEYYAGLDIGRTNDLTALVVVRLTSGGVRVVEHVETRRRTDSDGLDAMVDGAMRAYGIRRLCVDSTGLGAFPAERMQRRYGRKRVEAVAFTSSSKEDLATGLFSAFVEGTLRIPLTDAGIPSSQAGTADALRNDVCAIRRIVTSAGNVRYDAPHTVDGHADRAWALALALHACSAPPNVRVERGNDDTSEDYPDPE